MWNVARRIAKLVLSISPNEASVVRRGFNFPSPEMRDRIERAGITFISGYNTALDSLPVEDLGQALDSIDPEWRGFAYEGAGMALALLDCVALGRPGRLDAFLQGPGGAHKYMVHVGAGWALARLPTGGRAAFKRLDPMLKWLALDGLGFHEGYFHWPQYASGKVTRKRPGGYGARAFDQGLGRSLWFVEGGQIDAIARRIEPFEKSRRADLWSGIGLACAYLGVLSARQFEQLGAAAGPYLGGVAQGAAFAAKARQRAGNPADHTEIACQLLCRTSAGIAAEITDAALRDVESAAALENDPEVPRYELWRERIAAILAHEGSITI